MRRILSALAIPIFAAIFFAPELFSGRVATTANMMRWYPWREGATAAQIASPSHNPDCNLSYYPRRAVLHDAWRERQLPLWNPDTFAGTPFLADPQAGVFYPLNWILLPFDPKWQMGAFLFLHAALGGLGLSALVRRLGVCTKVALLAGCAFSLNGYFAKHFGQPTFLATASWVPWVAFFALGVRAAPSARRAAFLGLAGALLFLAGQPQTAAHAASAIAIVVLALGVPRERLGRAIPATLAAGVVAALVVAAQLLPTIELAGRSLRAELPYATVLSGAFHPADAIRLLVDDFFGSPLTLDEWSDRFQRGDGFYIRHQLNSVFAGTPVFFLALFAAFGFVAPRNRRTALAFTILLALSIAVAFGTPLARLAYEAVPGFRFARLDRLGFFAVFAQSVLGALCAQAILEGAVSRRSRRIAGIALIAASIAGAAGVAASGAGLPRALGTDAPLDSATAARTARRTGTAALFAAGAGAALLAPSAVAAACAPIGLAAVQLFLLASPYCGDRAASEVFAPHEGLAALQDMLDEGAGGGRFLRFGRDPSTRGVPVSSVLPPSTNVPFGLRDLQGYNALADSTLGRTLETALGEPLFSTGIWTGRRILEPTQARSLEHPLLDALAVRAVVSDRPIEAAGWTPVPCAGFHVAQNDEALGRVQLVEEGRGVPAAEMDAILRSRAFDPRRLAIWVGEGDLGPHPADSTASLSSTIQVLVDGTREIVVRAECRRPSLLVIADSWWPGWRARVDGNSAKILRVWGVVRGVRLQPGSHLVEMRFEPTSFRIGTLLSIGGLFLAGGMIAWTRSPSRR